MKSLSTIFILAALSSIGLEAKIVTNYSPNNQGNAEYSQYPDQSQNGYYHQQSMNDEQAYLKQANTRNNRLNDQNRGMFYQDQSMTRQGYEPNEINNFHSNELNHDTSYSPSFNSYPQEQFDHGAYNHPYSQGQFDHPAAYDNNPYSQGTYDHQSFSGHEQMMHGDATPQHWGH